ncbi:MAG: NirD/YgiW/YdeI family stress tolerance protein [Alphaproteobacteria bacterium]|nr:NirD/YgiW/YdeI family stress tolerance protein [Alphaproteobacteria bacterium]
MKKISQLAIMIGTCLFINSIANAQNMNPPQAPTPTKTTVEQAKNMPDESFVIMEGTITSNLGDEVYVFTDSTGSINIEIDDEEWNGINPNTDEIIMIQGEIDKDGNIVEIDVEEVMMPQ